MVAGKQHARQHGKHQNHQHNDFFAFLGRIRFAAALGNACQVEHDVQHQRARHQGDNARNAQCEYLAQMLAEDFQVKHLHQNENKNPINQQDK